MRATYPVCSPLLLPNHVPVACRHISTISLFLFAHRAPQKTWGFRFALNYVHSSTTHIFVCIQIRVSSRTLFPSKSPVPRSAIAPFSWATKGGTQETDNAIFEILTENLHWTDENLRSRCGPPSTGSIIGLAFTTRRADDVFSSPCISPAMKMHKYLREEVGICMEDSTSSKSWVLK